MPPAENKALIRQFIDEVFNKHNLAAIDRYLAAGYVEHSAMPGQPPGVQGFKQGLATFFAAFPDIHFTIDDIIAEGDKVVVRGTSRATHKGEFMGMAATGKQVTVPEIHIGRVVGGKLVEHWGLEDNMGMMQQLGVTHK